MSFAPRFLLPVDGGIPSLFIPVGGIERHANPPYCYSEQEQEMAAGPTTGPDVESSCKFHLWFGYNVVSFVNPCHFLGVLGSVLLSSPGNDLIFCESLHAGPFFHTGSGEQCRRTD